MTYRPLYCKSLLRLISRTFGSKNLSTGQAVLPELDEAVRSDIEFNNLKPRKHPGVMKIGTCSLPDNIVEAIRIISEDHQVSDLVGDAKMLANYLFSRHYPWEEEDLSERRAGFKDDVKKKFGEIPEGASEEQVHHYNSIVKNSVAQLMSKYQYKWTPLDLHEYSSMVYLFTRAAANYAATMRVFHEIVKQCPEYKPKSLFDFGSGVGSVTWAAKTCWGDTLKQFINVDSSTSMNNLSELILKEGREEAPSPVGVYYREFLPAQHTKNSLVVCAHSLMELDSRQSRLNLLLNLWRKTEDFLVIIEQGTKPGFKLVLEARDFILSLSDEKSTGYVFAPCPHDGPCPRFLRGPYPCHFQVPYVDLDIGKRQTNRKELLSYVIIKKGKKEESKGWPRVVRPVLQRHNHVICRLCTVEGDLQEIIFTKSKHDKVLYKCAKKTNWGDLLPVALPSISTENSSEQSSELHISNSEKKPPD